MSWKKFIIDATIIYNFMKNSNEFGRPMTQRTEAVAATRAGCDFRL